MLGTVAISVGGSNARNVALLAAAGIVIGSIGPWQTTFIVDAAGTDGDGQYTLGMALIGGFLAFSQEPGSRWLWVAAALGVLCAFVGVVDIVAIYDAEQELFGEEIEIVKPGWGLWVTIVSSAAFTVGSYWLYTEDQADTVQPN